MTLAAPEDQARRGPGLQRRHVLATGQKTRSFAGKVITSIGLDGCSKLQLQAVPMGDKSPKAKDKHKKQETAGKNQKKAAAFAKTHPAPSAPGKKGK